MPLFLFPNLTFEVVPFALTLEGQYIIKNLVLVAAALVVGATVRGGRLTAEAPPADGLEADRQATGTAEPSDKRTDGTPAQSPTRP